MSVAKGFACFTGSCLTMLACAGPQEQALHDLTRIEDGLRSGTVITAISEREPRGSLALERCAVYENSIRVDTITGYQAGKPLTDPTVIVEISTPARKLSASVLLRGSFPNGDAVFAQLHSKPAPEVREIEGEQPLDARSLQVLGYTGSFWLSQKLRQAGDGSVKRQGHEELISWGEKTPLRTTVHLRDNQPILAGYEYRPGPNNRAFQRFSIQPVTPEKGAVATFEKITVGSEADERYRLSILRVEHSVPPKDYFKLAEPEHSLINSVEDPEGVYQVVNGKRVKNYRKPAPPPKSPSPFALMGLGVGGAIFLASGGMLLKTAVSRRR